MKKLVNLRNYVAIGNDDYCDTSIWNHIRYVDEKECETVEYTLETFEEACKAVSENRIRNGEMNSTLFGNKPLIEISWGDIYKCKTVLSQKNFKPIHVKWQWEEVDRMYTMKDLASVLPADQFCEWLKDRGITMVGSL